MDIYDFAAVGGCLVGLVVLIGIAVSLAGGRARNNF